MPQQGRRRESAAFTAARRYSASDGGSGNAARAEIRLLQRTRAGPQDFSRWEDAQCTRGMAVFRRLAERMEERPGLRVQLLLDVHRQPGKAAPAEELPRRFAHRFASQEWPGKQLPQLYHDPRSLDRKAVKRSSLHAKCVVLDRRVALVTSASFTEAAQTRNIEVGALIRWEGFAARLAGHFAALVDAGLLQPLDLF